MVDLRLEVTIINLRNIVIDCFQFLLQFFSVIIYMLNFLSYFICSRLYPKMCAIGTVFIYYILRKVWIDLTYFACLSLFQILEINYELIRVCIDYQNNGIVNEQDLAL